MSVVECLSIVEDDDFEEGLGKVGISRLELLILVEEDISQTVDQGVKE